LFEPTLEIVPSIEKTKDAVTKLVCPAKVNIPVAPANRPVPPVMIAVSILSNTPGVAVGINCPKKGPEMESPLAAIQWKVPVKLPSQTFGIKFAVPVKGPRWVAFSRVGYGEAEHASATAGHRRPHVRRDVSRDGTFERDLIAGHGDGRDKHCRKADEDQVRQNISIFHNMISLRLF
jgi:hypothetical protein